MFTIRPVTIVTYRASYCTICKNQNDHFWCRNILSLRCLCHLIPSQLWRWKLVSLEVWIKMTNEVNNAGRLKMEFGFFFVGLARFNSLSLLPWREFCSLEQWALQPHRDQCHSQTVTHKHRHTKSCQVWQEPTHTHTYANPYHLAHTPRHTLFHLPAILTSFPWRGAA